MQFHLTIIGILLIALALLHSIFPHYFRWKTTTQSLELVTREVLYVHTFFIALTVFMMGLLCLSSSELLLTTELGKRICSGMAAFWSIRLIFQFFVYSPELWKGKTFETIVHICFSCLWLYISAVFWKVTVSF